ncbi:MAG: PD40 domain-containing protein [Bdellovibrionaceae bacterium]|nr:PD40 domain-containing protein [Bdellovibrionales bacterium]MCB9084907.1 PD40 domain-containing protein [Pseudobdellovibrionaceae bacterium]
MRLYRHPGTWILLLGFGFLFSCQSEQKSKDAGETAGVTKPQPKPPKGYEPAEAKLVTGEGENWDGHFSPDGRKVLYLSKNRPKHKHSQVYEFDRVTLRHRRITFHDGENSGPRYDSSGKWILYASTTDEIKENPAYIQKALKELSSAKTEEKTVTSTSSAAPWLELPYEIYRSSTNGNDIERLTHTPSYDAEASYHPSLPTILFTSVRHGRPMLYMMNVDGSSQKLLSDSRFIEAEGQFHPGGKELVFVRYSSDMKQAQIVFKDTKTKEEKNLTLPTAVSWSPVWLPDGEHILFASNLDDPENFEIYAIKKDGSCLQRLTYSLGNDVQPAISPDGKSVLFTSDRGGSRQLYLMDFKPPTTCPKS